MYLLHTFSVHNPYFIFQDGMKIMQPYLMVILIDYTSPTSTVTTFQAYLTVVALAVSTFIFLFSSSHLFFWNKVTALHIRAALSAMIYKKVCDKRIDKYY